MVVILRRSRRISILSFYPNVTIEILHCVQNDKLIPIMIKMCAFVISTGGPQSGLKWRDLAADEKQA
jgi:hypothetical protein